MVREHYTNTNCVSLYTNNDQLYIKYDSMHMKFDPEIENSYPENHKTLLEKLNNT